jgi:ATP adenylyltransferase
MDKLWAPWRAQYIQKIPKIKKCIFCLAAKNIPNKKNYVLKKTKYSVVMLNIYPYNNGHLMVAPRRHVAGIDLLKSEELMDLMTAVQELIPVLRKVLNPEGFNVGVNMGKIAGAGFDKHLHVHIVPRWGGDTNFMPVCGNTKVISQSLNALYLQIKRWLPENK